MEFNEFLNLIKRKTQTIFTIIFVATMLIIVISLASSLKYSVSSRLLVIQDSSTSDVYSLSRSNEYLGNLFSQVVYSSSFYDQVLSSRYNVEKGYFSGDYGQQLKKWRKTVSTKTQGDTGIIEVNVYHPQVAEAKKIALAVNDILINNNKDYQGSQNVKVKILDQPLASSYPTKPNVVINVAATIFLAFIFSLFYIYMLPEEKYNIYLFGRPNKRNKKIKDRGILDKFELENNNNDARYVPLNEKTEEVDNDDDNNDDDNINNRPELRGNIRNIVSR